MADPGNEIHDEIFAGKIQCKVARKSMTREAAKSHKHTNTSE